MNRKKLSPEEIQELRCNAEKERATHAEVMKNIHAVTMSPQLQMTTLMSSYNRHRNDEIMALLQVHTLGNRQYELATEVMKFIYDHGQELSKAKDFMLKNNHLVYEIEKRIFDDKLTPFITTAGGKVIYPKFSADAEVYMVKETLKACRKADKLTDELNFLDIYTQEHTLTAAGEIALMEFLLETHGRDSVLDTLCSFVMTYIGRHQNIVQPAWLSAIKSGNHDVIMHLITQTSTLTEDCAVVEALLERADEQEVTAYYNRWSRG